MKNVKLFSAILLLLAITSCNKKEGTTAPPVDPNVFDVTKATLLKQGSFSGNANYAVSGTARLYEYQNKKYIYFDNFSTSSGPDLKVYVATTTNAAQFISLGTIKGTSGVQVYEVASPPDFNLYKIVLIWCQQFSVRFGAATLQ